MDVKAETPIGGNASMDMVIAVGFGEAKVLRDDAVVYDGMEAFNIAIEEKDLLKVSDIERLARTNPEHDWRIIMHAPFRNEEYQRQGAGVWALYFSGEGFA